SALKRREPFHGSRPSLPDTATGSHVLPSRNNKLHGNSPRRIPTGRTCHYSGGRHWTIHLRKAVRGDSHVQQPGIRDLGRMAETDTRKRDSRHHFFLLVPLSVQ